MPRKPKADPPRTQLRKRVTDDDASYAEVSESELDCNAEKQSKKTKGKGHARVIQEFEFVKSWILSEKSPLTVEDDTCSLSSSQLENPAPC